MSNPPSPSHAAIPLLDPPHRLATQVGGFLALCLGLWIFDALARRRDGVERVETDGPLLGVFAISALARIVVLLALLPGIREVRKVRPISFSSVIFRVTRVNALAGLVFDIVGARPRGAGPKPDAATPGRERD